MTCVTKCWMKKYKEPQYKSDRRKKSGRDQSVPEDKSEVVQTKVMRVRA